MSGFPLRLTILTSVISCCATIATAQDTPGQVVAAAVGINSHSGSSPFDPPKQNDQTYIADTGAGLDTGCTFRSGGPLIITLPVDRFVGNVAALKTNNLISTTARLEMPAFDVDSSGGGGSIQPERDRVSFNGRIVPNEYLSGLNGTWIMNRFDVPIEWINFSADPGAGGTLVPANNTIRIDIDTANSNIEAWCTAIDWVSLTMQVARPTVMVHGILSSGSTWSSLWGPKLTNVGLPFSNALNMGNLDSIANNANKIGAEIAGLRSRWGLDSVNILAHSKGGIDSRHFVESNDSVQHLVQIGTPNAGSRLANFIQGLVVGATGPVPAFLINALAGPAGVQLTTWYMNNYNNSHGFNNKVEYTSLAGIYHPRPLLDPIDFGLQGIVGLGDTVVSAASVFELGYASHLQFESSGADTQAKHTSQTGSQGVLNVLFGSVTALQSSVQSAVQQATPTQTVSIVKAISQGDTQSSPVQVDTTSAVTFMLMYPSGDLTFELVSPLGQVFNPSTIVGNPNVSHEKREVLGGQFEIFRITDPDLGEWTAHVVGANVVEPGGSVVYAVSAWLEDSDVSFNVAPEPANIHAGDTLMLRATLHRGGLPILNATVGARLLLPDDTPVGISLHDDGLAGDQVAADGVYTGTFNATAQSGNYRIVVRATGDDSTPPKFTREEFVLVSVSSSSSAFSGNYQDAGIDTDGDGLYNELVINVGLNITTAATYRVLGTLTDASGNVLVSSIQQSLTPGTTSLPLRFDGATIFARGVDGPYTLSRVVLAEESPLSVMPVEERLNVFQTAAYKAAAFQHTPLFLVGNGVATGVDTNSNGLFDQLIATVDVGATAGGFYNWSGRLTDKNGQEIALAGNAGSLIAGQQTITLTFSGLAIGQHGVDGPYRVRDLLMFGNNVSLSVANVFDTQPFRANQFEGFVPKNRPPVADAGGPYGPIEATSPSGAAVDLDGSESSDPDGDALTYSWAAPGVTFSDASAQKPTATFPLGTTVGTLVVSDGELTSTSTFTVVVADTTAPVILSTVPSPAVLWPANHKMVSTSLTVKVSDLVDLQPKCQITAIRSNEPADGKGDGDTEIDFVITGALTADLRAERSGRGVGRTYTIDVSCVDFLNNGSKASTSVHVPRNMR